MKGIITTANIGLNEIYKKGGEVFTRSFVFPFSLELMQKNATEQSGRHLSIRCIFLRDSLPFSIPPFCKLH